MTNGNQASRPSMPRTCRAPGCKTKISARSASGMCRQHNHTQGLCLCLQCQARGRGCEMTREQDEAARKMKMGRDERDHHLRVMARLWNCSIAEAAARLSKEAAA